ncbi:MAG TPA: UbiA prenyltransferase family protein [Candidatus Nanoarchaeia archaeon]|nr:UbiA prenyltransferase family protein [Candidatus Nanoarchaeia archaeon]
MRSSHSLSLRERFSDLLSLFRVKQWYKNLVIFIPLLFTRGLFNFNLFLLTFAGFLCLCLMSSANYVINDLLDYDSDRLNPLKKHRPIASGAVSKRLAFFSFLVLFVVSLFFSYLLGFVFMLFPLFLFVSTLLYSVWLKRVPLVDLLVIAFNFVLRTNSGAVLLGVTVSEWLTLMIFLLALFLGLGKRYGTVLKLGKKASSYRKVFSFYSKELTGSLLNIVVGMLLISYCFYTFFGQANRFIMFSIPVFFFVVFRYLSLIYQGSLLSLNTELLFKDKPLFFGLTVWFVIVLLVLY